MRKKASNPISLFSFQDIITCLTGIMIVVVLVILLRPAGLMGYKEFPDLFKKSGKKKSTGGA